MLNSFKKAIRVRVDTDAQLCHLSIRSTEYKVEVYKIQLGDITYLIEVKFHTKVSQSIVGGWWDQAINQCDLQAATYMNPVPILIYKQTHWKQWECRLPWYHMLWQLGKTAFHSKLTSVKDQHTTVPIDILTDIMNGGKLQTISKGKMITTDNNDIDRTTLGVKP